MLNYELLSHILEYFSRCKGIILEIQLRFKSIIPVMVNGLKTAVIACYLSSILVKTKAFIAGPAVVGFSEASGFDAGMTSPREPVIFFMSDKYGTEAVGI